ncbi:alanine--tRNA ligase, cytoplasmic-like [Lytechinus variegatus]|uniref:alanine--tRNA ligase, cytoplasmic-like n=1 Tax=Lytechinus variegatus TaxID=7654 RepID=UPI001BB2C1AC|nr:alanine--tRNA ligase, cytoplasmic-like [Lytechinus variegatus]XP_041475737.1 alanine--tRNA ligase, cytoplasmic-like [Lytechinus variegatus]
MSGLCAFTPARKMAALRAAGTVHHYQRYYRLATQLSAKHFLRCTSLDDQKPIAKVHTSPRTSAGLLRPGQSREFLPAGEVRKMFLDYFQGPNDHVFVPSSSVIPYGDPTLLFTNAGMNQFKDIFQGTIRPDMVQNCYRRVVNSQKCIRVGGKHNDLDDVGKDITHHTFFEMLGNWSFGDFFKKEACTMALDLLTSVYRLPIENLYFTYFKGHNELQLEADEATRQIWLDLGVPKDRVLPFGLADNFWEMGAVGPCGPCTEIHFDRHGNRNASHLVNSGDPDVLEIWNLVFMQFYRNEAGSLYNLPKHHVDTGMGLERLVSILQGVPSSYDTDLFQPLIKTLEEKCPVRPYQGLFGEKDQDHVDTAYRAVSDHVRMLTVAIADGCRPDSQKRGYVIKRVIRRAVRYATEKLQASSGTLGSLVPLVVNSLGNTFPELEENPGYIADVLNREEEQFLTTLRKGEKYLKKAITELGAHEVLPGDVAWKMYDAYGFPLDLTTLIANENGLGVDIEGFEKSRMESKEITSKGGIKNEQLLSNNKLETTDISHLQEQSVKDTDDSYKYNYQHLKHGKYTFPLIHSHILALKTPEGFVESIQSGQECGIILDRTTFYAEQGGQQWDQGSFVSAHDEELMFSVYDVQSYGGYILHLGTTAEAVSVGDHVTLYVNEDRREKLMRNHTATHILNFALRQVLGHVEQKGSMVAPDRFRFDFNTEKSISDRKLQQISSIANNLISESLPVHRESIPLQKALGLEGLRTMTGETYPDPVTVVSIGHHDGQLIGDMNAVGMETSLELCGGTHVQNTGHIRRLVIVSEKLVSKGVRRLTVVTSNDVMLADYTSNKFLQRLGQLETEIHNVWTSNNPESRDSVMESLETFMHDVEGAHIDLWKKREMNRRVADMQNKLKKADKLNKKSVIRQVSARLNEEFRHGNTNQSCLVGMAGDSIDNKVLLKIQQSLEDDFGSTPVMLFSTDKEKAYCICKVPQEFVSRGLHASQWMDFVMSEIKGKGFGTETFARGRGLASYSLEECSEKARQYVVQRLEEDT